MVQLVIENRKHTIVNLLRCCSRNPGLVDTLAVGRFCIKCHLDHGRHGVIVWCLVIRDYYRNAQAVVYRDKYGSCGSASVMLDSALERLTVFQMGVCCCNIK
jgi:hypothetical protein